MRTPRERPARREPRWGRRTVAAGLAASALTFTGCAPHETTGNNTSSYWHWDHDPTPDEQRIGDDIRHAIEDEHAPGDEAYDRAVAKYGPYKQQPGESDAAWCRRSRLMFREVGADVSEMDCAANGKHYDDPELSPHADHWN
jgi:hypothetical protein